MYLLLGQSANQLLFKQRLDTERDELLVFQLKQDVVQYALSLLKDILGEWQHKKCIFDSVFKEAIRMFEMLFRLNIY